MEDNKRRPAPASRSGLGRGLSALFGDAAPSLTPPGLAAVGGAANGGAADASRTVLPIARLRPGRFQPRRVFDEEAMQELVDSIKARGIIQPLIVRPDPQTPEQFEIIAGERRWRAAQQAGLHEVPVVLRSFTDQEALEIALIENLQRQDLSPLEEAEGYKRLQDEFARTQQEVARILGRSRSHVANMLRLLGLPEAVKAMVIAGDLSAGHARALLTAPDPVALAHDVVRLGLNVRQTEQRVRNAGVAATVPVAVATAAGNPRSRPDKDPDTLALEAELSAITGLKAVISGSGGTGVLSLHYHSLDQLDEVLRRLRQEG